MKKGSERNKLKDKEVRYSEKKLPPIPLIKEWLLNENIFSEKDLSAFAFLNLSQPAQQTINDRTELVDSIIEAAQKQKTVHILVRLILQRRPYLETNERPTPLLPEQKQIAHATLTGIYCYFSESEHLSFTLEELGLLVEDHFNTTGYFHTYVWEALSEIERADMTTHPKVLKLLRKIPTLSIRVRRAQREKFSPIAKLPTTLNEAQESVVKTALEQLTETDILRIIRAYDYLAVPYPNVPKSRQIELLVYFAQQTQSANKLLTALHYCYPNLDLKVFNLQQRIRSALNIQAVRHFARKEVLETAQTYPHTLTKPSLLVHELHRNSGITLHQAARTAQILGYAVDTKKGKYRLIEQLVYSAQARSEIRALITTLLALYPKVEIPSVEKVTK